MSVSELHSVLRHSVVMTDFMTDGDMALRPHSVSVIGILMPHNLNETDASLLSEMPKTFKGSVQRHYKGSGYNVKNLFTIFPTNLLMEV